VFKAPWATVVATASWSGTPLPIATLISSAPTQSAIATATDAASTLGDVDATPTHSLAIGLGTGLGVGVVIALALGWVVMRRRRQRKEKTSTKSTNHGYGEMAAQDIVETDGRERLTEKDGKEVAELQDTGKSAEVVGDVYRAELPGCPVTDIKRS
jgi:Tfp pilus assembly protein FimV